MDETEATIGQQTPAIAPEAPAAEAAPPPEVEDYGKLLERIPDEVLLRDQRFNNKVGNLLQARLQAERARDDQERADRARAEAEQRLIAEAEANPYEFTQKWLKGKAEETARREFESVQTRARSEILAQVGQSFGVLPDWKELTPAELADVAQSVAGLPEDQLIGAFNAKAIDVIANRRASARAETLARQRLAAEREAWTREQAAQRLNGSPVPNMQAGMTPNTRFDPSKLSDSDFDTWWKQTYG